MGEPSFPLTGGCGCGAVRFEIREPFASANYCHCTRCQRRTGTAASANGRTAPGSEGGAEKVFCGLCGSAVFSRSAGDPPAIGVRFGALDSDPGIRPQWRQYVAYAASWEEIPDDGLPRYPEGRT